MKFPEAARLTRPLIYGFSDGKAIFYVGKTRSPWSRFGSGYYARHPNLHLKRRMREVGDRLDVVVLQFDPADLDAAEHEEIVRHSPEITNIILNPYRADGGLRIEPKAMDSVSICVTCDAPITVRKSKYCRKCLGALLGKRGQSKQELREICKSAMADYSSR